MQSTDINTSAPSIRQFIMMADKNNLLFDYPIQRSSGQWKRLQKSYLIHSLAADYPIPPVYLLSSVEERPIKKNAQTVVEPVTIRFVLDGVQRLTTVRDYKYGLFALDRATPNVVIEGEEFELAGKKFDALADEVQEMILSRTLISYTINSENVTDEEIEDLFFRMNNGTGLSTAHKSKALMGTEWAKRIVAVGNHEVFKDSIHGFSATQLKSDAHLTTIMQAMMMMDQYPYKNVSQKVISDYGKTFKDDTDQKIELLDQVKHALDYLRQVFDKKENFLLKKVHFPMTLLTAIEAIKKDIKPSDFADWAYTFKEACKSKQSITHFPTNYMDYSGVGSTDRPKADGRMNEMIRHFNDYLKVHNLITPSTEYATADSK